MARKRYKPEEIVAKLWQVDVLVSQGARELRAGSIGTSCVDHPSPSLANDRFAPLSASPPAVAARSTLDGLALEILGIGAASVMISSRYAIANRPFAPRRSPCWQPNDRAPRRPRCRCDSECRPRCATRWLLGRAWQAWRHHAGTGIRGWRPSRSKGSRARLDSLDGSVLRTVVSRLDRVGRGEWPSRHICYPSRRCRYQARRCFGARRRVPPTADCRRAGTRG